MMLHIFTLLLATTVAAYQHLDLQYADDSVNNMDMYLIDAPLHVSNEHDILRMLDGAIDSWNFVPNNPVRINIENVYAADVPCEPAYSGSQKNGAICFNRIGHPAYVDYVFTRGSQNTISAVNLFINTNHVSSHWMLFNLFLHEFGHINMLDHPTHWYSLFDGGEETPIMARAIDFDVEKNEYTTDPTYHKLTIDDIIGIMVRRRT
jgi:hypothetical protein